MNSYMKFEYIYKKTLDLAYDKWSSSEIFGNGFAFCAFPWDRGPIYTPIVFDCFAVLLCKWCRTKISIEKGICKFVSPCMIKKVDSVRQRFSWRVFLWREKSMELCGEVLEARFYVYVSVPYCCRR